VSELELTFGRSLRHRGDELLHDPGIPLLYPWANRLAGFEYGVLGKEVALDRTSSLLELDQNGLPIHGLLSKWSPTTHLDFGAEPELLEGFPFPHTLRLSFEVEDSQVRIATTVEADRDSGVPVSFGYHPYFQLPGTPRQKWQIEIPVRERLVLDERMIPTGEREPAGSLDGPLGDRSFDDAFKGVEHGRPFVLEGGGRRIEVRFDERFPFAQVYSPPGAEFICFEPMTAPTNALRSGEDLPIVEPGESFTAAWTIAVTATS
jgi:galactose mutarotase-like enzyme